MIYELRDHIGKYSALFVYVLQRKTHGAHEQSWIYPNAAS